MTHTQEPHGEAPFDGIAAGYDADFSHTALGRLLRRELWGVLDLHLPRQGRLLELGCGTGLDAERMAQAGAQVVATDVSARMLERCAERCTGLDVETVRVDLSAPATEVASGPFDGAWSSFGPINCVPDRTALWPWLARRLRPGARLVLVPMSPTAPWDWLWFGGHGQLGPASRRLRASRGRAANAGAGRDVQVVYPTWRRLAREAAGAFTLQDVVGLGVLLPISEAGHLVDRAPALFSALALVERRLARAPGARSWCDHTALVLERRR